MIWSPRRSLFLILVTCIAILGLHFSAKESAIATAPQPPQLVIAKLGGKPVHVLYMTRSGDRVLVRCYPGQTPILTVKDMGEQPGVKEGMLVCQ
ncbi:hypothetical protein [Leptothermofonsia sp. ETS-13]|uniref:hypothetical protein n=1 Tax=Leptothermofonsia sp. ETS-13 TaxID=3035696 RepID=UPI003BA2263A